MGGITAFQTMIYSIGNGQRRTQAGRWPDETVRGAVTGGRALLVIGAGNGADCGSGASALGGLEMLGGGAVSP